MRWAKNRKAQQWKFDPVAKVIRNMNWTNYVMEIPSSGNAADLKISGTISSRHWQLFRWQAPYMVNEKGKVLDVHSGKDEENRNIIVWKKHGGLNQQWDLIYADAYPDEAKKGELNKKFGLYVERTFYVVSQMSSHRYLDIIDGRNIVIKTRNGRNTQEWYFHQTSWTIRSRSNNQSWDIHNSGKSNHLQIWSTT